MDSVPYNLSRNNRSAMVETRYGMVETPAEWLKRDTSASENTRWT